VQINAKNFKTAEGVVDNATGFFDLNLTYTLWVEWHLGFFEKEPSAENQSDDGGKNTAGVNHRRQLELSCLSGSYLGAQYKNDKDDIDFFNYIYNKNDNIIADTSKAETNAEPSGQHQLDWFRKGVDSGGRPSVCNTWKAPACEVS
jgi:hypothetical protein